MTAPELSRDAQAPRRLVLQALSTLPMTAALPGHSASPPSVPAAATLELLDLLVGSYGPHGQGLYRLTLDARDASPVRQDLTPQAGNPSWLALDAARGHVYTADEHASLDGQGSLSAYTLAPEGLRLLNRVPAGGAAPVHLDLHPDGRHLLAACYGSGRISLFTREADGRLNAPQQRLSTQDAAGADVRPGPARALNAPPGSHAISGHDAPHAHMAAWTPDGGWVLATDLGLDRLLWWRWRAGRLESPRSLAMVPGSGPRHFAFHPRRGECCYVLNEESSTLAWLHWDAGQGQMTLRDETSTLPPGFAGTSFASGLVTPPDGRQLYALNRLHDSIAIFDLDAAGRPRWRESVWTRGSYPRSATLVGRWLFVCNQRSDHVAVFERMADGGLRFADRYLPVPAPAHLIALPGS